MTCASCGTELPVGAKFCLECGTPVVSGCANCGTELPSGAKFCLECGTPTTASRAATTPTPAAAPSAERRVTSVLFGDLVGFTTLSESRDPEEVRELLSRYFDTAREIVARYGGTIEKFIGDAVMAVWGVPTAHEDDAERAVRAGLDLVDSVASFGESVGAPGLSMRVGVVTGEVAVTLGAVNQGMVAGDAVNTAARVQAQAEPGTVWVDAQTRSLAGGAIDFVDVGTHQLKGKVDAVALFSVRGVMRATAGELSGDRVLAPLVGRRRELANLRELFHASGDEQRARLVLVSGEPGVGKTRLGWELRKYVDGLSSSVLWHWGRCLSYGDGVAFSALSAAVRSRAHLGEDAADAAVRTGLIEMLTEYVPDPAERDWLAPRMSALLTSDTGQHTREDLFAAWLTWFERLAQANGEQVVWVIDDAQHADEGLLDFIEHLTTAAREPVLIVVLARPDLLERRPRLARVRGANLIGLETLSDNDTAALLDLLVEGLPSGVRDELVRRAEGNPLYAIETVRSMHDQGLTVGGPVRTPGAQRLADGITAEQLRALAAPPSLQVLVASRLDLLSTEQRAALASASVLGQTFTLHALAAVTGRDPTGLQAALRELIARDLLTTITDRLASEAGQYAFVQAVVRTVAYQTQSRQDRLDAHLAAVDYLEPLAETDGEIGTVVAQHLREAYELTSATDPRRESLRSRRVDWLKRAARRAAAVGAPDQAVRAYKEAIELVDDPLEEATLRVAAADTSTVLGSYALTEDLVGAIARGERSAGPDDRGLAVALLARDRRQAGATEGVKDLLLPYFDADAFAALSDRTAARLARELSNAEGLESPDRQRWADLALAYSERSRDPALIAYALNQHAIVHFQRNQPRIARAIFDAMIAHCREHRLASPLALGLANQASYAVGRDVDAAIAAAEESTQHARQAGDVDIGAYGLSLLSMSLLAAGRWNEIEPIWSAASFGTTDDPVANFTRAVTLARLARYRDLPADFERIPLSVDDVDQQSYTAVWTTLTSVVDWLEEGRLAEAAAAVESAAHLAVQYGGFEDDASHHVPFAIELNVEAGDFAGARRVLAWVGETDAHLVPPVTAARCRAYAAIIDATDPSATVDAVEVEAALRSSVAELADHKLVPDAARTAAVLGVWLTRQGRLADASEQLRVARAAFAELGARRWERELDEALAVAEAG
jgi:class 3 adenylate cyclase